MKEEADRTGFVLKAGPHLRPTVDLELYAQYGNNIPTGKPGHLDGRTPGLVRRLSVA